MGAIVNTAPPRDVASSISALRHHAHLATAVMQLLPLVYDGTLRPLNYGAPDQREIERALALDAKLPSYEQLRDWERQFDDAISGPPADADALGRLLPLLFAGRSAGRPEAVPARLAILMEIVAIEGRIKHCTADAVALAVLNDLRSNRFPPDPADFLAGLATARAQIFSAADGLRGLMDVRGSVDDILIGAGLREFVEDDDCPIPWDTPSLPKSKESK